MFGGIAPECGGIVGVERVHGDLCMVIGCYHCKAPYPLDGSEIPSLIVPCKPLIGLALGRVLQMVPETLIKHPTVATLDPPK